MWSFITFVPRHLLCISCARVQDPGRRLHAVVKKSRNLLVERVSHTGPVAPILCSKMPVVAFYSLNLFLKGRTSVPGTLLGNRAAWDCSWISRGPGVACAAPPVSRAAARRVQVRRHQRPDHTQHMHDRTLVRNRFLKKMGPLGVLIPMFRYQQDAG